MSLLKLFLNILLSEWLCWFNI